MFGAITEKRLKYLQEILDNLPGLTRDDIKSSSLPQFNRKFILEEAKNITDRKHLDTLLDKSVKLNINYAIRPKWTLLNYLYGGFESKSADEILRKVEIFQFYKFYSEQIANFIRTSSPIFITSTGVEELIDDTNTVLFEKLTSDITGIKIKNFFIQIFKLKYGEEKEITLEDSIPFIFVRLFLEDKKFSELIEKFKVIKGLKDDDEIELKILIKILKNKYESSYDSVIKVKKEDLEKPDKIDIEKEETGEKEILNKDKSIRKIKISNRVEREESLFGKEAEIPEIKAGDEIHEEKSITDAFERRISGPEGKKIRRIFKEGELNIIAKKAFKSSRLSMFSAFDEMEKLKTWKDAVDYLKELFRKNHVDPYNKNVVLFIDLLHDYFSNKEKGYL